MKGGCALVVGLVLAITPAAALPLPGAPEPQGALALLAANPERAPEVGARLAALASQPSGLAVLQGMLAAAGHPAQPLAVEASPLAGAPPELALALGRLLAAAQLAEELRAQAVAALSPEEVAFVLDHGLFELSAAEPLPALPEGVHGQVAGLSAGALQLSPRAEAIAAKVKAEDFHVAALTLLSAVESSVPELQAAAERQGPGVESHCGTTGTIRFETSDCRIVVGDTGPNDYVTADPLVLVDLGGNDRYFSATATARSGVRVLVDAGSGSDLYQRTAASASPGTTATAEGIAVAGIGVVVLSDLGGNDVYEATSTTTAPQPGPVAGIARVVSQAVANLGAAVLLDAGGSDSFRAAAQSSGGGAVVLGQGHSGVGLAALLNLGASDPAADDRYLASAGSTLHLIERTNTSSRYSIGPGDVQGQGVGLLGGVGLLSDAGGGDSYAAQVNAGVATVLAQGAGNGGAGLLVDAQGNDDFLASAIGDTTLALVVNNGDDLFCWTVTVTVVTGETRAAAQGVGTLAGVLVDAQGNDAHRVVASSFAGAISEIYSNIDCTSLGGNKAIATATSGGGTALGQGSSGTGIAALIDLTGADTNSLSASTAALARALAISPGPDVETATATAGSGRTQGQGQTAAGVALLADVMGADAYGSSASSTATRQTSAGTTITLGPVQQLIQGHGTGGGAGWLLELDGMDTYTHSPAGASLATNNKCWSNAANGRGRDVQGALGLLTTPGCP